MKSICIFLCLLLFVPGFLSAQLVSDPNDVLYTWLSIWEEKGYLTNLPPLRPYPIQLVKELLQQVKEVGSEAEAELAEIYLQRIDVSLGDNIPNRSLPAPLNIAIENHTWTKFDEHRNDMLVSLIIQGSICDLVSFSGRIAWGGSLESTGFFGPEWMNIIDESKSGGGNEMIFGMKAWAKNLGTGGMTVGSSDIYFQAGLMRSSFGPFFENGVVIGPQCPATGHFSFNYTADWITVSSVMLVLQPKYFSDMYQAQPFNSAYEKYLVIHSYIFNPWEWFEFGILQSVVFGGRFNPVYLLPFAHMFFVQQIYGDDDSSLLGLYLKFRLPLNIRLKFMCYLDDFNTDTFFGTDGRSGIFSLDNAQNKAALQVGLTWTPDMEVLKRVSLDYLMVTPYTYTHYDYGSNNEHMFSYTHLGEGIGTILEPNSDQITVTTFLQLTQWWDASLLCRFARHGNASEGYTDDGDGSYYDTGFDDIGPTFIAPARFLTQDVIEYVFQAGCNLDFSFGLEWAELTCGIGYLFEYVYNKDLIAGSEEFNHFVKLFLKLTL